MAALNSNQVLDLTDSLAPGSKLCRGLYTIESFLSSGGWGKVYVARDSLDEKVVIKECYPAGFCRRDGTAVVATTKENEKVLKVAVENLGVEAQTCKVCDHPAIVHVHQFFEDNGTGYIAMEYIEGAELHTYVEGGYRFSALSFRWFMKRMLDCLEYLHTHRALHRDISSDNIVLRSPEDPVLIDFGAAKMLSGEIAEKNRRMFVAKDGFSPIEVYDNPSEQTYRSDIYALAATFHFALTGDVPPSAKDRKFAVAAGEADPLVSLVGRFPDLDESILASFDKAMSLNPEDRFESVAEWRAAFNLDDKVVPIRDDVEIEAPKAEAEKQPAAVAEDEKKGGSKAGMALAAGLAVAALAGGGYYAMTSGSAPKNSAEPDLAQIAEPALATALAALPVEEIEPAPASVVATVPNVIEDAIAQAPVTPTVTLPADAASSAQSGEAIAKPEVASASPSLDEPNTDLATPAVTEQAPEVSMAGVDAVVPQVDAEHGVLATSLTLALPAPASPLASASVNVGATPLVEIPSALKQVQVTSVAWTDAVPFQTQLAVSRKGTPVVQVASVNDAMPAGVVSTGTVILRANGQHIRTPNDLSRVVSQARAKGADEHLYSLHIDTADLNGRGQSSGDVIVGDQGVMSLANGLELVASYRGQAWELRVTKAAPGSDLAVNDVLQSVSDAPLAGFNDLTTRLDAAVAQNQGALPVGVMRDGQDLRVTLALAAE